MTSSPDDCVEKHATEIGGPPAVVKMPAGKTETTGSICSFDSPANGIWLGLIRWGDLQNR